MAGTDAVLDQQLDRAIDLQRAGNLDDAEAIYLQVLKVSPAHAEAHHLLGLLHHQRGDHAKAAALIAKAVDAAPQISQFCFNLGLVQTAAGMFKDATETFAALLKTEPKNPDIMNAYAIALKAVGNIDEAEQTLDQLCRGFPNFAGGHLNLGNLCLSQGRAQTAVQCFERAHKIAPRDEGIAMNLATALQATGQWQRAKQLLEDLLAASPDNSGAMNNIGNLYRQSGDLDAAETALRRAIKIDPGLADAAYNLGVLLTTKNDLSAGRDMLKKAAHLRTGFVKADWAATLALPQIYASADERAQARADWLNGLERITSSKTPERSADALGAISEITPFALAYQGEDDTAAMTRWGNHVSRVAAHAFPNIATPPKPQQGTRKRIGFVSAHFRTHTICNLFADWLSGLNPDAFEVHLISTSGITDSRTDELVSKVTAAHVSPMGIGERAHHIHNLGLDALIYLDIGMDPLTQVLAALPLAPRQFMGWGHPVTSGLPHIDTFISAELMEPEGSAEHYRERLVKLPGLSITYDRPAIPKDPIHHDFLCAQSLFKVPPEQDAVFADILQETSGATLSFFAHPIAEITKTFRNRLAAALITKSIDADASLHFIDPCDRTTFLRHLAGARVILDTFAWSGGNTSLEAFAMGVPIITFPGRFMRGRHTYAMLRQMELPDHIASDADNYIEIACNMLSTKANDEARNAIRANSDGLYNDPRIMPALNDLLSAI